MEVAASRRGLAIVHVFDSSPAARAGLRAGESIVAVNGRSIAGMPVDTVARSDHRAARDRSDVVGRTARGPRGAQAQADPRDDLRAGRRLDDDQARQRQARRRRARDVQRRRARRSARSRRTRAELGRARDRARPAPERRRPGRGGAADREHLHRARHDRHHARAQPADADAERGRRRDQTAISDGGARRQRHAPRRPRS